MSAVCEICDRKPHFSYQVSFSHRRSKRRWSPNVQKIRIFDNGRVRRAHGAPAEADALLELIERCPEVEGEELSPEDRKVLHTALTMVGDVWEALGAVDDERRLTALGRWGLPKALRVAWS